MKGSVTTTRIVGALLALMMILTLVMVPNHSRVAASDEGAVVDLVLLPPTQIVNVGDTFDVTIEARCHGQEITGIAAFLDFDPTYLEVQSIQAGATLDVRLLNTYDNDAGTVDYSAGKLTPPFPSGTFTVAVVTFRAKAGTDSTPISFHRVLPRLTDADFGGMSKLDEAIGETVTTRGVPPPRHTLTVTIDPPEGGTVFLSPGQPAEGYESETEVTLTAEPAAGWEFERWSGDVAGVESTITLTMDADKSVTAHFEVIPDVIRPEVISVSPEDGARDMAVGTSISVTFSEVMDKAAVGGAFSIEPEIPGAFNWVDETLAFNPDADLARGTTYTITISTAARDLAGNGLAAPYTWSFTTEPVSLWWVWLIIGMLAAGVLIYFLVIRRRR